MAASFVISNQRRDVRLWQILLQKSAIRGARRLKRFLEAICCHPLHWERRF